MHLFSTSLLRFLSAGAGVQLLSLYLCLTASAAAVNSERTYELCNKLNQN